MKGQIMNRIKSILIILVITCTLITGCSLFTRDSGDELIFDSVNTEKSKLIVDGILVPKQTTEILSSLNEKVESLMVSEGDTVKQGDLLLKMTGREAFQANISAAQLEITQAQNEIDALKRLSSLELDKAKLSLAQNELDFIAAQEAFKTFDTDDYQKKIDDARVDRNDIEDDLATANDNLDSFKDLDGDNVLRVNAENKVSDLEVKLEDSQRKLDRLIHEKEKARLSLTIAEDTVTEARFQVDQKVNGADEIKMSLLNVSLTKAQSDYDSALERLEKTEYHSPFSGKVMHVFIESGDTVVPGQTLIIIGDVSQWYIETKDLTELDVKNVVIGDQISMAADAIPDLNFLGTVEKISDWYYEKGGDIHYQVRILLSKPDPKLRWGMTFKLEFP
jgi:multidrug resistance efflux pump